MRFISKLHVLFVCIKTLIRRTLYMEHSDIDDADDFKSDERRLKFYTNYIEFRHVLKMLKTKVLP